jgi:hypothetical protein
VHDVHHGRELYERQRAQVPLRLLRGELK